jgi:signal transduction histidine kinase
VAFGYLAFRDFRSELLARHELALAEQRRAGEQVLARENRTATMLTLAAGVAHEVGTPLGLVQVKAEALRDALADTPEEADARTILAQVHRLREVVQGFLRVARGRAPDQVSIQPVSLVHAVQALVQHRFEAAGVGLVVEIDGDDVPGIRASRLLVEHALVNLLINACDASPRGSTVRLRARRDGDAVCFDVLDEGEGLGSEDPELLLEPFLSRKDHGTGLGLAITHEIARMHRGEVALRPREKRGTAATLRLPQEAT